MNAIIFAALVVLAAVFAASVILNHNENKVQREHIRRMDAGDFPYYRCDGK